VDPTEQGGWRIVIPMPEAINFVDGRRQKYIYTYIYIWQKSQHLPKKSKFAKNAEKFRKASTAS
jgi:hypothetical protein